MYHAVVETYHAVVETYHAVVETYHAVVTKSAFDVQMNDSKDAEDLH